MKLLSVSLAYPPLAYPRSIQVARLLKHADLPTVLFCADEPGARLDNTIEPDAESRLEKCIRVPVETSGVSRLVDRFSFRFARGVWNRRNHTPDHYGGWKRVVLGRVRDYVKNSDFRPDAVVTFAQPFTDHLIGLELKKTLKLPWLAHFSDPWVDNPFASSDAETRKQNLGLERAVAENADMLVFTSHETVTQFFQKYPADLKRKARVLPQCFDPDLFGDRGLPGSGKITIRYLGNFYGRRTPRPLIEALLELYRSQPATLTNVLVELVGAGDAEEVRELSAQLPDELLGVRPSVSYSESLDLMTESDGLLIIDAPADLSVFLPSKLIDYIGAARPVFGITPKGTAASLIQQLGGHVADPSDGTEVSLQLANFIRYLKDRRSSGSIEHWGNENIRERFTTAAVANDFRSMLKELISGQ